MDKREVFEIVKKYITYLKNNNIDVQNVYMFGSYAEGSYGEDSDIDLAIIMKNVSNSFTMQIELMKLSRKIDTRIEPHPFDESDFEISNPFANEILTKGIQVI